MSKNLVTIILFALIAGFKTMDYSISLKDAYQRLQNEKYRIFQSDSFGNIQYKIIKRDAAPILVIHGISGGFDQGIKSGLNLIPENHSILSISRFGHLESDIPNDSSPINQCRAYLEILIFRFMLNNMQRTMLKMFGVTRDEYLSGEAHEKKKLTAPLIK